MKATLSLLGLYNYDSTILDGLTLPSNFDDGDDDILKNNLLMETAELELLYTNPTFLSYAITQWCSKESAKWNWLKATQQYDYNPIWNADYTIADDTLETRNLAGTNDTTQNFTRDLAENEDTTETITENSTSMQTDNRNINTTHGGDVVTEISNHTNEKSGDDTILNSVYSYNDQDSGNPRDSQKTSYDSTNTENGTTTVTDETEINEAHTGTTTIDNSGTTTDVTDRDMTQTGTTTTTTDNDSTDTGTVDTTYSRTLQGNYGSTTTQQMIKEEQELAKFNVFDYIIADFKKRFCLLVY